MKIPRDTRENKLPKWAQELIEETRIGLALRWPSEPEPEPSFSVTRRGDARLSENVFWSPPDYALGATWFRLLGSSTQPLVKSVFIAMNRIEFQDEEAAKIAQGHHYRGGYQCEGPYWSNRRDALLAGHWRACRDFAGRLAVIIDLIEKEPVE